jgi:hypothetical protein
MKLNLLKVPVRLALEYAFAAHRINQGYVKSSNDENVFANKDIVSLALKTHLIKQKSGEYYYIPNHFVVPEITDQDRASADGIDQHFKKYMFRSLASRLNQFENDVYTAVCSDEVPVSRAGLIAYVPELINRDRAQWDYEKMIKSQYSASKAVESETVSGTMTILRVREIVKDLNRFTMITAGMDGNLYEFAHKKITTEQQGSDFAIQGRVKGHGVEYHTKIPLTKLNYVKAILCPNQ